MPDTNHTSGGRRGVRISARFLRLLLLGLFAFTLAGCSRPGAAGLGPKRAADPFAAIQKIAAEYARDGDLAAAQAAIGKLSLANPTQLLATLAEEALAQDRPERDAIARLAAAMGANSPKLQAYLQPTAAPREPPVPPPTEAPPPSATASPAPTDTAAPTAVPVTATVEPTAPPTATAAPQAPRVVAEADVNLRGGPGKQYPMVGKLRAGQEVEIIGRNASGDWWQLDWDGQAWVAGTVVKVQGPIDTVAVAKKIPAPPVRPTPPPAPPAPAPTAAPAVPAPKPGVAYVVKSVRLRPLGEGAQRCDGGDHNIFIVVTDAAGNPLDGVRVREIFSGIINPTGSQGKGAGRSEYDIYRGGGGQIDIVDDAGSRISELTRGMSDDWPPFDLMRDAGYCTCKPHPDDASCQADLENKGYLFAVGHYVYEVVFQRTF